MRDVGMCISGMLTDPPKEGRVLADFCFYGHQKVPGLEKAKSESLPPFFEKASDQSVSWGGVDWLIGWHTNTCIRLMQSVLFFFVFPHNEANISVQLTHL